MTRKPLTVLGILRTLVADLVSLFQNYTFELLPEPFAPEVEKKLLKDFFSNSQSILEFGSGGSTLFAVNKGKQTISVESDKKFYVHMINFLKENYPESVENIRLANIGLTGRYGMPIFYPFSLNLFSKGLTYVLTSYCQYKAEPPELVFVDGRW